MRVGFQTFQTWLRYLTWMLKMYFRNETYSWLEDIQPRFLWMFGVRVFCRLSYFANRMGSRVFFHQTSWQPCFRSSPTILAMAGESFYTPPCNWYNFCIFLLLAKGPTHWVDFLGPKQGFEQGCFSKCFGFPRGTSLYWVLGIGLRKMITWAVIPTWSYFLGDE